MRHLALALTTAALAACGTADASDEAASAAMASETPATVASAAELPPIVVYKTASCGCCKGWVEHLQAAGFEVDARDTRELMAVKIDAGVPTQMSSCHTALVDGYVVEGHVPADVVARLLAERPDVAGIAVPGMPIGSPGMEGPGARPYEVHAFHADGTTEVFAEVDPR
ncbi:MAG: DUF411 domain-containing protein [Longimicrobiales bacterium]